MILLLYIMNIIYPMHIMYKIYNTLFFFLSLFYLMTPLEHIDFHNISDWTSSISSLWHFFRGNPLSPQRILFLTSGKGSFIGEWPICGGGWLERFYCVLLSYRSILLNDLKFNVPSSDCFLQNQLKRSSKTFPFLNKDTCAWLLFSKAIFIERDCVSVILDIIWWLWTVMGGCVWMVVDSRTKIKYYLSVLDLGYCSQVYLNTSFILTSPCV